MGLKELKIKLRSVVADEGIKPEGEASLSKRFREVWSDRKA